MSVSLERPRLMQVLALVGALSALLVIVFAPPARSATTTQMAMGTTPETPASAASTLRSRFDYLSHQQSNTCMLQPSGFASMAPNARLQGACCAAMVYKDYVKQIHGLANYSHDLVPRDPYDISVSMARKLVAFNGKILLTNSQQEVYNRAMRMADEHGPCCCHCWRWNAFEGQAKALMVYRRYTSAQIAALWDLEDGCGGGSSGGGMMGPGGGMMG
jgi:hypothetical protein